ncbi:MAG: type II toxin-antitoxin system RelE/ParE family toxin [Thermodesulfovibrionales bacterium]|jgi:mRNA interferase RelE/StbE
MEQLYKLRVPEDLAHLVRTLHPHLWKKVKMALQAILADPDSGKALKDELAGLRSFRVSRFRITYKVSPRRYVEIVAIGPRARIYEETYRKMKREELL